MMGGPVSEKDDAVNVPHGDEQKFQERLRFRQLDAAASQALQASAEALKPFLKSSIDALYEHMASWPNLMEMFADRSRMEHARKSQFEHWSRLFSGDFGPEYAASVQRIGRTHSRIGLEPQWFLGAYARVTADLQRAALELALPRLAKDPQAADRLKALLSAIVRATNFDMDLVVSVYLEDQRQRHQKAVQTLSATFRNSVAATIDRSTSDLEAASAQIRASVDENGKQSRRADDSVRRAHLSLQSVAAALEEVSRSVTEIRQQTAHSRAVAEDAVARTRGVNQAMSGLEGAVSRINDSVAAINDIAERTNILAINASIEAARAGVVGKGFAVVAAEVRKLAGQTVEATEAIRGQTDELRAASGKSRDAVEGIVGIIGQIDRTSSSIAGAVEEQGVVTQEIARDAQAAADQSVEVTRAIEELARSTDETGQVTGSLSQVVRTMKDDLGRLNAEVDDFLEKLV